MTLLATERRSRTVGRLLRTLRIAAGLSVDDAALAAELSPIRIRELEAGLVALEYLDGLVLSKAYLLCATCFARHYRGAVARGEVDSDGFSVEPTSRNAVSREEE